MADYNLTVAGETHTVPESSLDDRMIRRLVEYGLKVKIERAAAGCKTDPERQEARRRMADQLARGVWAETGTRASDPITKEAKRLATEKVDAAAKSKGVDLDKDRRRTLIDELAARDDIRAQAKRNVDAANEIEIELDI